MGVENAEQHPVQVQSKHLLFLHLDPTACHVPSTSSWQWVASFFKPFTKHSAFDSDTRAHSSKVTAKYFMVAVKLEDPRAGKEAEVKQSSRKLRSSQSIEQADHHKGNNVL